jgi:lipoprotein signal peptidase
MTPTRQIGPEPYWIAAAGLVIADQLSKWLVLGLSAPITFPGVFIGEALNANGLLGMDLSNAFLAVCGLIICGVILALLAFKAERPPIRLGLWLLLGGAFSNTLDRFLHGGVVDIISIFDLSQFNLADVMILLGVLSLLRGIWWKDDWSAGG